MTILIHEQEVCWLYIHTTYGVTTTDGKMRSMNDEGPDAEPRSEQTNRPDPEW
jgi:hypothetical protein